MTDWFRRNGFPTLVTIAAAAAVIAGFEAVDALIASPDIVPTAPNEEPGAALALAGLVKVSLFLAVSIAVTQLVRSRTGRAEHRRSPEPN